MPLCSVFQEREFKCHEACYDTDIVSKYNTSFFIINIIIITIVIALFVLHHFEVLLLHFHYTH